MKTIVRAQPTALLSFKTHWRRFVSKQIQKKAQTFLLRFRSAIETKCFTQVRVVDLSLLLAGVADEGSANKN
jgi:hypothetical protein